MITEKNVVYAVSNLADQPLFTPLSREAHGEIIAITYSFPLPISWHGDNYTWDSRHLVTYIEKGESDDVVTERIRQRIKTILEWEHRKTTENLNNDLTGL